MLVGDSCRGLDCTIHVLERTKRYSECSNILDLDYFSVNYVFINNVTCYDDIYWRKK